MPNHALHLLPNSRLGTRTGEHAEYLQAADGMGVAESGVRRLEVVTVPSVEPKRLDGVLVIDDGNDDVPGNQLTRFPAAPVSQVGIICAYYLKARSKNDPLQRLFADWLLASRAALTRTTLRRIQTRK
jgi:DNA-binding transcriptional LysR family regulator